MKIANEIHQKNLSSVGLSKFYKSIVDYASLFNDDIGHTERVAILVQILPYMKQHQKHQDRFEALNEFYKHICLACNDNLTLFEAEKEKYERSSRGKKKTATTE